MVEIRAEHPGGRRPGWRQGPHHHLRGGRQRAQPVGHQMPQPATRSVPHDRTTHRAPHDEADPWRRDVRSGGRQRMHDQRPAAGSAAGPNDGRELGTRTKSGSSWQHRECLCAIRPPAADGPSGAGSTARHARRAYASAAGSRASCAGGDCWAETYACSLRTAPDHDSLCTRITEQNRGSTSRRRSTRGEPIRRGEGTAQPSNRVRPRNDTVRPVLASNRSMPACHASLWTTA